MPSEPEESGAPTPDDEAPVDAPVDAGVDSASVSISMIEPEVKRYVRR
jgi:hypothetical protein